MTTSWHTLVSEAEFPAEGKLATKIGGWHVLLAKTDRERERGRAYDLSRAEKG